MIRRGNEERIKVTNEERKKTENIGIESRKWKTDGKDRGRDEEERERKEKKKQKGKRGEEGAKTCMKGARSGNTWGE